MKQFGLNAPDFDTFQRYFETYGKKELYFLPQHFLFCKILEAMWTKTFTGRIPPYVGSGVRWHAGEDHNTWIWALSDRCHDWDCVADKHMGTNENSKGINTQAFMLWLQRQDGIGTLNMGKWTRSTHKHGRVRAALYMPSDYTGEWLKKELQKVKDHVAAIAERWPTLQQQAAHDPVANLW
jgi:hypothetical protein